MKICFIVMSCDKHPYPEEERYVKETWAKDIIEGKYENTGFLIYRGGGKETSYDENTRILRLKTGDSWDYTYTKTVECLKYVRSLGYDWIVKTNTSNYVNVRLTLDFIKSLPEGDDKMYGPKILCVPKDRLCFLRGNFNIFSPAITDDIIKTYKANAKGTDDTCISKRLYALYGKEYYSKIIQLPEMGIKDLDFSKCDNVLNFRLKGVTVGRGVIIGREKIKKKMYITHREIMKRDGFTIPEPKTPKGTLERVRKYRAAIGDLPRKTNTPTPVKPRKKTIGKTGISLHNFLN